ncbi:MAG: hypothetical protein EXQ84_01555 [Rhodospirillaceae bacterium]|nr:hypothetical protein [Rhodospirillaceae bacterium]
MANKSSSSPASRYGNAMNPRRVIVWMTVAVFVVLTALAIAFFNGIPPWPVLLCFAISHGAFCVIVSRVKPYRGPYKEPMNDPDPSEWSER